MYNYTKIPLPQEMLVYYLIKMFVLRLILILHFHTNINTYAFIHIQVLYIQVKLQYSVTHLAPMQLSKQKIPAIQHFKLLPHSITYKFQ